MTEADLVELWQAAETRPQQVRPCEYLGISGGHHTAYAFPTEHHRCSWGGYRLVPSLRQQEEFCLQDRASECPILLGLQPRADQRGSGYGRKGAGRTPLWKRLTRKS